MANNLDISVIDIHNEFFKKKNPLDYFPFLNMDITMKKVTENVDLF